MEAGHLFKLCLLVEDDPAHAHVISRALRSFCTEILHQDNLQGAMAMRSSLLPDLIVTDLRLPDCAGAEVVSKLSQAWPGVPLLVLTSSTLLQDAVEAMKAGAKDFLVKTFETNFSDMLGLSLSRVSAAVMLEYEKNKLRSEMEALRVAIENSNDGLAVSDQRGALVYYNRSFESFVRVCGGSTGDLSAIFSEKVEQGPELCRTLQDKAASLPVGAVWHTEVKFVGDKNLAFDFSLSAMRAGGDKNPAAPPAQTKECVIWVRNITEEKRREKFQREILSTTTHDLKNPLAAILTCAELVSGMVQENRKAAELIVRIGSAAQSAVNLIDEFLSARRIKEGTFILRPAPHDIVAIIEDVAENFQTMASAKGINLKFERHCAEQQWCVDKVGLQRLVSNVLSNAVKFTPRGGEVRVKTQVTAESLHIAISDSGSGMEPSEVNKIFERFSRLEKHAAIPGSGIGLFVVKSIVAAHGGKIEVTSQSGHGTCFEIILPDKPPVNERGELISLDFT